MSSATTRTRSQKILNGVFVVICLLSFFAASLATGIFCYKSHRVYTEIQNASASDSQKFSEGIKAGILHTSESSQSLAQTILLIAAALWGLIIGKEDERKLILGNRLTCSMAILANFTVFAFLYSYHVLDSVISRILFTAEVVGGQEYILHIDNMRLSDLFSYQLVTFIAAAVSIGSTILCAHALKQEN